LPAADILMICRRPSADPNSNVLVMNLSFHAATNNGLACLSDAIEIQPGMRYRLGLRYRSEGPNIQVFVKGYTSALDIAGRPSDQEVYRLQAPPAGGTGGKWQTLEADLNPKNPAYPVQRLRVDLYANGAPGVVMFTDVVLKAIGPQAPLPATQP
jgi:hypothetical protein